MLKIDDEADAGNEDERLDVCGKMTLLTMTKTAVMKRENQS